MTREVVVAGEVVIRFPRHWWQILPWRGWFPHRTYIGERCWIAFQWTPSAAPPANDGERKP